MNWNKVREKYKERWVLIEVLEAETRDLSRIVLDMLVINDFDDSGIALREYVKRHKEDRTREMYVCHTKHAELIIKVKKRIGVRGI